MQQAATPCAATPRTGFGARMLRRALQRRLVGLQDASLTFRDAHGEHTFGTDQTGNRTARLEIRDPRFYRHVALGGSVGAAEAYRDGMWETDDLAAVVRALVHNRDLLNGMEGGATRLLAPLRAVAHAWKKNNRRGSRRNIAAHYDLSNDFFAAMLDETMTYSCARFERPGMSLAAAQRAKLDRCARLLDLQPADHLLEIGTGWGSMAIHAAREYGCRVTTTTISAAQHKWAQQRINAAGVADRVTLLQRDYRDLEGTFDKAISIEMIEAVGHEYYPGYFSHVARLLRTEGTFLMQAITVPDRHYDECRREVDFIKKYIFPGCCIPAVGPLVRAMAQASDLRLHALHDQTEHYAETLRRWSRNVTTQKEHIRELGFDEPFFRLWEFYLRYCEGGYEERFLGNIHLLFAKPGHR